MKTIPVLEINLCKSCNWRGNLEKKTRVLMISAKYLRIYGINCLVKESSTKKNYVNESRKEANFANFRCNNCIFSYVFQKIIYKKIPFFINQWWKKKCCKIFSNLRNQLQKCACFKKSAGKNKMLQQNKCIFMQPI